MPSYGELFVSAVTSHHCHVIMMMITMAFLFISYVLKGSESSCPAASVDAVAMPTDAVAKTTVSQPPPEPPEKPAPVPVETPAPPTEVGAPMNHHPVKQEEEEPSTSREQGVRPKTTQPPKAKLMPQEDDERPGTSQQCHGSAPSVTPTDFVPFSGSGQRLGGTGTAGLKMSTSWSSCVSGSPPKAKKPKPSQEIKVCLLPVSSCAVWLFHHGNKLCFKTHRWTKMMFLKEVSLFCSSRLHLFD